MVIILGSRFNIINNRLIIIFKMGLLLMMVFKIIKRIKGLEKIKLLFYLVNRIRCKILISLQQLYLRKFIWLIKNLGSCFIAIKFCVFIFFRYLLLVGMLELLIFI